MEFIMGFIKVEISLPEAVKSVKRFKENRLKALEFFSHELKESRVRRIRGMFWVG